MKCQLNQELLNQLNQLNQELLWPTNGHKQLFDTQVSKPSILAVQGLSALDPQGHYKAFPRILRGTESGAL